MLPVKTDEDGADWYDLEKTELVPLFRFALVMPNLSWKSAGSLTGDGVVPAELMSSSRSSDEAEISGEAEEWSLSVVCKASGGAEPS